MKSRHNHAPSCQFSGQRGQVQPKRVSFFKIPRHKIWTGQSHQCSVRFSSIHCHYCWFCFGHKWEICPPLFSRSIGERKTPRACQLLLHPIYIILDDLSRLIRSCNLAATGWPAAACTHFYCLFWLCFFLPSVIVQLCFYSANLSLSHVCFLGRQ